jgi:hypothetical protein
MSLRTNLFFTIQHWLIEWLAYHYHVLPLRYLVVVRDPSSQTSSQEIFNRWNNTQRMLIEEWADERVMPSYVYSYGKRKKRSDLYFHLNRQQYFYADCMRYLKRLGVADWVLLTDTDEFVRINPSVYPVSPEVLMQPGHVSAFLEYKKVSNKCLHVPRLQISSEKMSSLKAKQIALNKSVEGLNVTEMLTYRWLQHNGKALKSGKNVVNLRALRYQNIPRRAASVHQVLGGLCPKNAASRLHHSESFLSINHYMGTYEQYSFRVDPRDYDSKDAARVKLQFQHAKVKSKTVASRVDTWFHKGRFPPARIFDNGTTFWLEGFVAEVGYDDALGLLKDVGVLSASGERRNAGGIAASSMP